MPSKWTSRKFWVAIVAMIYSVVATVGADLPIEEIIVVDAIAAVWILVEGIVDAVRAR